MGDSELSSIITVPIADYPDAPATLARTSSTRTSISVEWAEVADTQLPSGLQSGYQLYMDSGIHDDFYLVYNGEGVPTVRTYTAESLVTGRPYRFYAVSLNHVGQSPAGTIVTIYACEHPSGLAKPEKVAVTQTSVTVKWSQPSNDGGCPVTSYSLLRDGGPNDETFVEVHSADVNEKPGLEEFTITDLPIDIIGSSLRIKV